MATEWGSVAMLGKGLTYHSPEMILCHNHNLPLKAQSVGDLELLTP